MKFPFQFSSFPSFWEEWGENWPCLFNEQSGVSCWEDKSCYYVEACVPDLCNKDIDVTFNNGILNIRGEK